MTTNTIRISRLKVGMKVIAIDSIPVGGAEGLEITKITWMGDVTRLTCALGNIETRALHVTVAN